MGGLDRRWSRGRLGLHLAVLLYLCMISTSLSSTSIVSLTDFRP